MAAALVRVPHVRVAVMVVHDAALVGMAHPPVVAVMGVVPNAVGVVPCAVMADAVVAVQSLMGTPVATITIVVMMLWVLTAPVLAIPVAMMAMTAVMAMPALAI